MYTDKKNMDVKEIRNRESYVTQPVYYSRLYGHTSDSSQYYKSDGLLQFIQR